MSDLIINGAILHIFDYGANISSLSETTMNLEDTTVSKYVRKQVQKIMYDPRNQKGFFYEDSACLELVEKFKKYEINLSTFSRELVNLFKDQLKTISAKSYDILFVSYNIDEQPYIGILFLENQQAYTHLTKQDGEAIVNTVVLQNSLLPSPTKKLNTYASIHLASLDISFCDMTNWADEEVSVMQDMILTCTNEKSYQEVMEDVEEIVSEVAIKCDENPTLLLSKYKNYVQDSVMEDKPISTQDLALHVFNESEVMQDEFISASMQHELPKEIEIPKKVTTAKLKQQKIKTDTGIELSFPTEYFENPDFIEFKNNADGTISIEIRNIAKIINK